VSIITEELFKLGDKSGTRFIAGSLKKYLPERSLYRGITLFTPQTMKEAEPLFRILPDKRFIELDAPCADILDIVVVYFFIAGEIDCVEINM
jgi:hypothetical protein